MYGEYLDWCLSSKPDGDLSPAKRIVFRMIWDLTDRRGLGDEWDATHDSIKDEIVKKWIELAEECLTKTT